MAGESLKSLLKTLLRREDNSPELVEELNWYLKDLEAGTLSSSDESYVRALGARLGISAPVLDASMDDDPGDGSFLNVLKATTRATEHEWVKSLEAHDAERIARLSAQFELLAERLEEAALEDARGEGFFGYATGQVCATLENEDGRPALFMSGNEKELESTPGYIILSEKCNDLGLDLRFKNNFSEAAQHQSQKGFHSLAPTLYHVDVVVSGWK